MGHGITVTDMVSYGEGKEAWHGLGNVWGEGTTLRELVADALPWTVSKVELEYNGFTVPDLVAVVRDDNDAYLGSVGPEYQLWQSYEALEFTESLFEDGIFEGASAGSLYGGKVCFMSAKLRDDMRIADDVFEQYMMVRFGHDGKTPVDVTPTNIRVVCANTVTAAIANAKSERHFKVKHTKNMGDKLAQAREALQVTVNWNAKLAEWLDKASVTRLDAATTDGIIDELFGLTADGGSTRAENKSIVFVEEYMSEEIRRNGPTAYSLFNAITGYANYGLEYRERENSEPLEERKFMSLIDGQGTDFIRKGKELLEVVVA